MAGRHTQRETEKTLALSILAVGTAVSLASLFGGAWVIRAGVIVAVVMAFAAAFVAFRQLRVERQVHQEELRRQLQLRNELVEGHHADAKAIIERFSARTENLTTQTNALRRQLSAAKAELSTMRGNAAWLRGEVAERQAQIVSLQQRVAELEQQIAAQDSNVVHMPRHGAPLQPSAEDIWGSDEHPTMVDLSSLQLDVALAERKQA